MRGAANVADVETGGDAVLCRAHAGEHEHITLTLTLTPTQVSMKEMLQCFKDAHIEHIVNENTLDLIMSYCDKTGDGEIDYNELAGLIMTGDILERGIPEHRVIKVEPRVGRNQIPVSVLRKAQKLIVEKLLTKFDTVRAALR